MISTIKTKVKGRGRVVRRFSLLSVKEDCRLGQRGRIYRLQERGERWSVFGSERDNRFKVGPRWQREREGQRVRVSQVRKRTCAQASVSREAPESLSGKKWLEPPDSDGPRIGWTGTQVALETS